MLTPSKIKSILLHVIDDVEQNIHLFVNSPGKDFTRQRNCPFQDCVKAILSFENHSLQKELDIYFGSSARTIPFASALIQQRNKFNDKLFPHIFHAFTSALPSNSVYRGFHLVAADATDINLPKLAEDLLYHVVYKKNSRTGGYWQMHVNTLYDLLEQRFVDVVLQPRPQMNEPAALCDMVDRYPQDQKALFICDRGYPSFNLLAHIIEHKHHFLMRTCNVFAPNSFLKHFDLPKEGAFDQDISLTLTRSRKKKYLKHPEKYRCLRPGRRFDYIPEDDKESVYIMNFRVVSLKLSSGNFEYLITTLPRSKFPASELKRLYFKRWGIETSYRSLKYALSLSTLHSVKREFIVQEVYAKLIMFNFTSLLAQTVKKDLPSKKKGNKWNYRVSFSNAASAAQVFLRKRITNAELRSRLLRNPSAIHYGRQNPRVLQTQSVRPLNNRG